MILVSLTVGFVAPGVAAGQTLIGAAERLGIEQKDSVAIFIDGNAKSVFGQGGNASSASGTVGIRRWGRSYFLSAQINVAASRDSIGRAFGATMLTPSSGAALNSGLVTIGLPSLGLNTLPKLGLLGYFSVSTQLWDLDEFRTDEDDPPQDAFQVPVIGLAVGPTFSLVDGILGTQPVAAGTYVALTYRQLFGDLANSHRSELRRAALGSGKEKFIGLEFGLDVQYGSVQGGLVFYFFDANVDGLSDGQVAAGIRISSDLIRGALGEETGGNR